jgi:hypothetical protein
MSQFQAVNDHIGFKELTSVVMKSSIFWDILLCESRWQAEPTFMLVSCLGYSSTLKIEEMFLQNVGWLSMHYMALYPRRQNSVNVQFTCASPSWYMTVTCTLTYRKFHCRYGEPHSLILYWLSTEKNQFLWRRLQFLVPQTEGNASRVSQSDTDNLKYHDELRGYTVSQIFR